MTGCPPLFVEASPLLPRHLTGMGRFVARLIEALVKHTPLRLVCTIQAHDARRMKQSTRLVCGQEIRLQPGELPGADDDIEGWVRRVLRRRVVRHDGDLAGRSTGLYTWLRPAHRHFRREINVLYDFTPLVLPWTHTEETRYAFGHFCAERVGTGDKAVAISASTKADAAWLSNLAPEQVVVGYPGPSLCVGKHAHAGPVPRRPDVVLVVSTLEPRKNARFLTEWFLSTGVLRAGTELWWVGPKGWLCDWFTRLSRNTNGRTIRLLGMVSDRRLCELYRTAAFTIYPSLYEGFGFPVLDALRHGTPVLCSYNSSLQEFAGPGVYYFDACDPVTLDAACRELQSGEPGFARPELDERFSWDELARTVLTLARD
jgi:glycosyltransferase involved in cell wall biosynthesis